MLVSGVGLVSGCGFLMLALINVVRMKIGTLECGSSQTLDAVVPLVILVPLALFLNQARNCSDNPKRCNIANRPVGYKCGAYTLP